MSRTIVFVVFGFASSKRSIDDETQAERGRAQQLDQDLDEQLERNLQNDPRPSGRCHQWPGC
jgi:hypothetical protein